MIVDFNVLKYLLHTQHRALLIPAEMHQHPASILHAISSSVSYPGDKFVGKHY